MLREPLEIQFAGHEFLGSSAEERDPPAVGAIRIRICGKLVPTPEQRRTGLALWSSG